MKINFIILDFGAAMVLLICIIIYFPKKVCEIKLYSIVGTMYIRYPKEIMKMERHFSVLQRWLQK